MRISDWSSDVCSSDLLRHGHPAAGRDHRIEVPRCLSINEIPARIAAPRFHNGEIGDEAGFKDIAFAVEQLNLLALRHDRANAGTRLEPGDHGATRPDAFSKRSLRIELPPIGIAECRGR